VRELQLAKAAIAAGLAILLNELGVSLQTLDHIYLAGAFGNYVNCDSACRIGLVPIPPEKVTQARNTALLGAKLALFPEHRCEFESLHNHLRHVSLNERADFQEIFVEQIGFPIAHPAFPPNGPFAKPTCLPRVATGPAINSVAGL
jgi:uncharacterized 2Fe-2S/4Fe-4S cluster protein (DUF4445 family)